MKFLREWWVLVSLKTLKSWVTGVSMPCHQMDLVGILFFQFLTPTGGQWGRPTPSSLWRTKHLDLRRLQEKKIVRAKLRV